MLKINIVTIFPDYFETPLTLSIPGRAQEKGLVECRVVDLRAYGVDRHQTTDAAPAGGGGGMVMRPEPFAAALESLGGGGRVVSMSPRGRPFDHENAVRFALEPELTVLCGRYKGIDERVVEELVDEEISLGDYVLSGGEPAALAVIDAVIRLLPGALGDHDSAASDSFYEKVLSAPSYTRPSTWRGRSVPEVLRSGDHDRVARWRMLQSLEATRERRPDLMDLDATD